MKMIFWSGIAVICAVSTPALARDMDGSGMHNQMHGMGMHQNMQSDRRISLGLMGPVKQHQLANMRSHLEAVSDIVDAIARGEFDQASETASRKLGLTPKMQKMCNAFDNADFRQMGLAFHKSGDELARVLKTHNTTASLQALRATMQYCTSCHSTYRQ